MLNIGAWKFDRRRYLFLAISFVFLLLYTATVQDTPGDTRDYITDVLNYSHNRGTAPAMMRWEFGHLLWRPLGYAGWRLTAPVTSVWFHNNPVIEIAAVFWAINFISGFCLVFIVLAIVNRLGIKHWTAFAITSSVLFSSAVLNYIHSGTSYIPGLVLQLAGLWFVLKAVQDDRNRISNAVCSGLALALACALWFPYFFGIPAVFIAALVLPPPATAQMRSERSALALSGYVLAATAVFGIAFFAAGAALAHIASVSQLYDWIWSSGHGISAHQRLLRFPTGFARTFFYLGDEGIMIKRLVFRDLYAPVNWAVVAGGLWKIVLVFLTFGTVLAMLARNRNTRWTLVIALGGIVPTLLFALLLFETSSAERYLPMFAGLVTAVCVLVRDGFALRSVKYLLILFASAMVTVNLYAYAGALRLEANQSTKRFELVATQIRQGGVAMILSVRDPLSEYLDREPFNPEDQPNALPLYEIIGVHVPELGSWKADSSCRILRAWDTGANAVLSKRLLASKPNPEWGWVENDDPSVRWVDVRDFFRQFDIATDVGDADGFIRIARSLRNQKILSSSCPASNSVLLLTARESR